MRQIGTMQYCYQGNILYGCHEATENKKRPWVLISNTRSMPLEFAVPYTLAKITSRRTTIWSIPVAITVDKANENGVDLSTNVRISYINPFCVVQLRPVDVKEQNFTCTGQCDPEAVKLASRFIRAWFNVDFNESIAELQQVLNDLAEYWKLFCKDYGISLDYAKVPVKVKSGIYNVMIGDEQLTPIVECLPDVHGKLEIPDIFLGGPKVDYLKELESKKEGTMKQDFFRGPSTKTSSKVEHPKAIYVNDDLKKKPVIKKSTNGPGKKHAMGEVITSHRTGNQIGKVILNNNPYRMTEGKYIKDEEETPTVWSDSESTSSTKINVPDIPEKKKTGRKPGPSNVESWSLSKTKDFIQSVRKTVLNDLNPNIELKEYGITESNFQRVFREAKNRIHEEDKKYVVFDIPRGQNPYLPQNKAKWVN